MRRQDCSNRSAINNFHLFKPSFLLMVMLLVCAARSYAQTPPLVYSVENTGASTPAVNFPDFAHTPLIRQLPDPFVFANGTRDTSWGAFEQHRNEWKQAIEKYEIGTKPDCHDCTVTAVFVPTVGQPTKGTLTVTIVRNGHSMTLPAAIVMPTPSATCVQPAGGWPYVMGMGGATGSWPASAFNASANSPNGVTVKPTGCAATVVYNLNNVTKYTGGGNANSPSGSHVADAFYTLYPEYCAGYCNAGNGYPNGSNHGQYAAWSWGVSRLIDGLQIATVAATNPLPLDMGHSAVTGCSYAGKMAMFAGAFDERVALSIPQENGGGGAPSWRVSHEVQVQGSVEQINDTSYEWFGSMMHKYDSEGIYKMPTDHFQLMAMMAPRAMLQTGDSNYYWLGDLSATFDSMATEAVYANYGIGDRFGYYDDTVHGHCAVPAYQQNATQPFINRFLFGSNVVTDVKVPEQFADALQPGAQPTWDPNMWTAWWGSGNPAFPAGDVWNSGGDVMLPLNQSLTLNAGDVVTTSYGMTMPGTHAAATVTVPTAFTEVDVACTDGTSYSFAVPNRNAAGYETNSQAYTIAANDNTTFTSNVYSAVNPGCSNGAPGTTTGAYFFALGLTNPGAGNPGLAGFSTTNGFQKSGATDPLSVSFNLANSTTSQGGTWAPWTTINRLNPYSCTPPGCPLTPTIAWTAPSNITYGTALSSAQLNAVASSTLLSGFTTTGTTGLLQTAPITGTWRYNPPAGPVLNAGVQTLSATFTPTAIITAATTNANAYKTYTISTASVPLTVTKADQTITLTSLPATSIYASTMPVTYSLNGAASSGLAVSYSVSGPATLSGTTLMVTGPGTVTVTVTQAGNSNYNAAPPLVETMLVGSVQLTPSTVLSNVGGAYQAVITVTNTGNVTAPSVQLTAATLGAASGTPLPASFGDIAGGGSASVTITFPASAGSSGAAVVERLTGKYTGGTFGGSSRTTLP